jgi:hypothetical protein
MRDELKLFGYPDLFIPHPSESMRLFTIEEANTLLPTARRILVKIQRAHSKVISQRTEAINAAEKAETGGGGMSGGMSYLVALSELAELTNELDSFGIQLKDFELGLIDFPSMQQGRVVLLCWKLGEGNKIEWWHDVETGFAGRQPL